VALFSFPLSSTSRRLRVASCIFQGAVRSIGCANSEARTLQRTMNSYPGHERARPGRGREEVDTVCCNTVQGRTVPRLEFGGGARVRSAEQLGPRSYRVTQQHSWMLLLTDLIFRYSDLAWCFSVLRCRRT
jgi:hypothetical protein